MKDSASKKKEAEKLEFEALLKLENVRTWRMNIRSFFRCKSSDSSNGREIESAKSIAELKTSYSFIGAKLQTYFLVFDSKTASAPKRIINGDFTSCTSPGQSCRQTLETLRFGL